MRVSMERGTGLRIRVICPSLLSEKDEALSRAGAGFDFDGYQYNRSWTIGFIELTMGGHYALVGSIPTLAQACG